MVFPVRRRLAGANAWPPTLVVVIDTEEEFDWNAPFDPHSVAVTNIAAQHLAQSILDRHGMVPTYAIDYPVANDAGAVAILRGFAEAGRCEIGAHLHPWVTPPAEGPIDDRHSFAGNLPPALERAKLAALTDRISDGFGRRPSLYKAGRYGIGPATAGILDALGYRIDASIVPYTDFSDRHGPDFRRYSPTAFAVGGTLIAMPLSVGFTGALAGSGPWLFPHLSGRRGQRLHLPGIAARLGLLQRLRLSPEGHSLGDMIQQTRAAMRRGERLFMMTYHSSSLLPGAAPYVRDEAGRDAFLARIDGYCRFFRDDIAGRTARLGDVAGWLADSAAN
jgi:hypothetical protein